MGRINLSKRDSTQSSAPPIHPISPSNMPKYLQQNFQPSSQSNDSTSRAMRNQLVPMVKNSSQYNMRINEDEEFEKLSKQMGRGSNGGGTS